MRSLVLAALAVYRNALRPLLPAACRFHPSCSDYARAAVLAHGCGRGLWLTLGRLARCHPFHPGGLDPVPPARMENRGRDRATAFFLRAAPVP